MRKCVTCAISEKFREHIIEEMMFGTRNQFKYLECNNCGCIQIEQIPTNLSKYYPSTYYSFNENRSHFLRSYLVSLRNKHSMGLYNPIGKLLSKKNPPPSFINAMKMVDAKLNWKILDVGSGSGENLKALKNIGFQKLHGIDPYIKNDLVYKNIVFINKMSISEVNGIFDLILFNHSLEHMQQPEDILNEVARITHNKSIVIVLIPIMGCYAWEKYGTKWVQLDVPRHIFIPTIKSMELLASRCGFKMIKYFFDSSAFQFWGSEQYVRGIPLVSPKSFSVNPKKSIFSKKQIKDFKIESTRLNLINNGDQACLIFKKIIN